MFVLSTALFQVHIIEEVKGGYRAADIAAAAIKVVVAADGAVGALAILVTCRDAALFGYTGPSLPK